MSAFLFKNKPEKSLPFCHSNWLEFTWSLRAALLPLMTKIVAMVTSYETLLEEKLFQNESETCCLLQQSFEVPQSFQTYQVEENISP